MKSECCSHLIIVAADRPVSDDSEILSVCLSVTSRCYTKRDERINLLFVTEASFDQYHTMFQGNSGIYKNKLLPSMELFPKLRTSKV